MLFLACRSVRNTLLKILVHVPGPQTWLPIAKIHNFEFQIEILSRPWKWKVGLPNNFPRYFGMYLTPPDTQNMKKKKFGAPQNFSKIAPEVPWFRCRRYSETSTRYSKTSTENGLVFLGLSTSQKTLKNYWGALPFISRPWKKSKFGSQMSIFLPLGAMFGAPEHGPKNSKMSFWHFYRPKTTHFLSILPVEIWSKLHF